MSGRFDRARTLEVLWQSSDNTFETVNQTKSTSPNLRTPVNANKRSMQINVKQILEKNPNLIEKLDQITQRSRTIVKSPLLGGKSRVGLPLPKKVTSTIYGTHIKKSAPQYYTNNKGKSVVKLKKCKLASTVPKPVFRKVKEESEMEDSNSEDEKVETCIHKNILEMNDQNYKQSVKKLEAQLNNFTEIDDISQHLAEHKIECIKYNYSLEEKVQNFTSYQATIRLSKDFQELIITNKKPIANEVYVLEADPMTVEKIRQQDIIIKLEEKKLMYQHLPVNLKKIKKETELLTKDFELSDFRDYIKTLKEETENLKGHHGDHYHEKEDEQFYEVKSKASFNISEVTGILFGPMNSRFWLYRKHMITMDVKKYQDEKNVPFFAWECLTIQLKHREVNLVIRQQKDMDKLIKFLIYSIDSINGQRGSSLKIQKTLIAQSNSYGSHQKLLKIKNTLMQKAFKKYIILRIRFKISFIAFIERQTISELILSKVLVTHQKLTREGLIPFYDKDIEEKNRLFDKVLVGDIVTSFKIVILLNEDKFQGNSPEMLELLKELKHRNCEDEEQQLKIQNDVKAVFDKNNCYDVFQNAKVKSGEFMYEPMVDKRRLKLKLDRSQRIQHYMKIMLIINLKAINKLLLIKARLKTIQLQKELFLLDIQQGRESYVPPELSQNHLPYSYRFYDPILEIVQDSLNDERKEFFYSKNVLNYKNFQETNLKQILYQKYFSGGDKKDLTFRYQVVNQKENNIIDHNKSMFTMNLQRSNYIKIDDEVTDPKQKPQQDSDIDGKLGGNKINIKFAYCQAQKVNEKWKSHMVFKMQFIAKQQYIKDQGNKNDQLEKAYRWISENHEKMFGKQFTSVKDIEGQIVKAAPQFNKSLKFKYAKSQQQIFAQTLLDYSESKILDKYNRKRQKNVRHFRAMLDPKRSFEQKSREIEFGVKDVLPYFDQKRIFISDEERQVILKIRKEIAKTERILAFKQ